MKIIFFTFLIFCSITIVTCSSYGMNALVNGNLIVNQDTNLEGDVQIGTATTLTIVPGTLSISGSLTLPQTIQIGSYNYTFPTSAPTSTSQVLSSSTTTQPFVLTWNDVASQQQVYLNTSSLSSGSSLVIVGSGSFLSIAGVKGGVGISVSGPSSGDVTITSTVNVSSPSTATGVSMTSGSNGNYYVNSAKAGTAMSITGSGTGDVTFNCLVNVSSPVGATGVAMTSGSNGNYYVNNIQAGTATSITGPVSGTLTISSTVNVSVPSGSSGVPMTSGSSGNYFVNSAKAGTAMSITGPVSGDVTFSCTVNVTSVTGSTGTSMVSGSSGNYFVNSAKAGAGMSITGPVSGDVTFASTILQTAVVYTITSHPTGATPNAATFPWPGWTSLVPILSTSTAPSSCVIYGSGANNVNCDLTNNSGSGTPQCISGNNNDLTFTTANPVSRNTCSSTFTNTLAGNSLQTLSLTCSGNIRSVMLICTI
jgi:hypothetical protein